MVTANADAGACAPTYVKVGIVRPKAPRVLARTPRARSRAGAAPGPHSGPLGAGARPRSCAGGAELTVTGSGATTVCSSVERVVLPSVARSSGAPMAQLLETTRESVAEGWGSEGTEVSTRAKLNALVRSPVADRRQSDRLGTSAPKRASSRRSTEVWSKVSEHTKPPRLNGETISIGTRKPSPIGPATPEASAGSGLTVMYSPAVPGGGTGGGTWSKKPPFSS